ncbi:substrate-binding domain-containing protein [Nostoc sp. ChiQUE01b]|uniref:substrate-binding domain-containing protein n=1 Tax=Nostoc sp. ChiQUE01b TaxID=3075376 RepID=UPI002AD36841|nr:OmpA family protein [Nostoc sp. ChiQUE01b]
MLLLVALLVIVISIKSPSHNSWQWFTSNRFEIGIGMLPVLFTTLYFFYKKQQNRIWTSPKWLKREWVFILIISLFWLVYLVFMPLKHMNKLEPEITINLCGSTTLGERFAPLFIQAIAQKNHAVSIESKTETAKDIYTTDAEFNKHRNNIIFKEFSRVRFIIDYEGTEDGFDKLNKKECDIAMASTTPTKTYHQEIKSFPGITIGEDAIVIITSQEKENLSSKELKDIFEGKNQEWEVFCRNKSGTNEELKKELELNIDLNNFSNCNYIDDNSEMLEKVSGDHSRKSIGYVSSSFLSSLLQEEGKDFYIVKVNGIYPFFTPERKPSTNSSTNKVDFKFINDEYPLRRSLYLYPQTYEKDEKDKLKDIVDKIVNYAVSENGQSIVQSVGFVSTFSTRLVAKDGLTGTALSKILSDTDDIYDYIKRHSQQSNDFAAHTVFLPKNGNLPEEEEMRGLSNWWSEIRKKPLTDTLVLIGHSSPKGVSPDYNLGLSLTRAKQIKYILQKEKEGASNIIIYGLGWEYPIYTPPEKNQRVEIYFLSKLQEIDKKLKAARQQ